MLRTIPVLRKGVYATNKSCPQKRRQPLGVYRQHKQICCGLKTYIKSGRESYTRVSNNLVAGPCPLTASLANWYIMSLIMLQSVHGKCLSLLMVLYVA
jgi:hypothetical protein